MKQPGERRESLLLLLHGLAVVIDDLLALIYVKHALLYLLRLHDTGKRAQSAAAPTETHLTLLFLPRLVGLADPAIFDQVVVVHITIAAAACRLAAAASAPLNN